MNANGRKMDPRYPIGKFQWNGSLSPDARKQAIDDIAALPGKMRAAVASLGEAQLETHYREGGWTIRQVVHHVADSHINSYVRFRLAMTEQDPTIRPYEEARWAELPDAKTLPVEVSLDLLEALHARWVVLLKSFADADWHRNFVHPEMGAVSLERAVGLYAWHGKHHLAHIANAPLGSG
jgi:hypothetical protein